MEAQSTKSVFNTTNRKESKTLSNHANEGALKVPYQNISSKLEEAITSMYAACLKARLTIMLLDAGYTVETIYSKCALTFQSGSIIKSKFEVQAIIPNISEKEFSIFIVRAKEFCPLSKAFDPPLEVTVALMPP